MPAASDRRSAASNRLASGRNGVGRGPITRSAGWRWGHRAAFGSASSLDHDSACRRVEAPGRGWLPRRGCAATTARWRTCPGVRVTGCCCSHRVSSVSRSTATSNGRSRTVPACLVSLGEQAVLRAQVVANGLRLHVEFSCCALRRHQLSSRGPERTDHLAGSEILQRRPRSIHAALTPQAAAQTRTVAR